MKLVFSTLDVAAMVEELRVNIMGCRVNNIYDVNNKTYLLKLTKDQEKMVVLLESGARFHLTEYQWAKNMMPSGFSMKLRKHIRNRKVNSISQLGLDRIIDVQFGFEENNYHLIIELYDRGNMCLTDQNYIILHLLRPRTDTNQDVRYAAHERYPVELVRPFPTVLRTAINKDLPELLASDLLPLLTDCKGPWTEKSTEIQQRSVQKVLSAQLGFGQATIDHCCRLADQAIQQDPVQGEDDTKVAYAKHFSRAMLGLMKGIYGRKSADHAPVGGYLFGKKQHPGDEELLTQEDFHPILFDQHNSKSYITFPTFSKAVDAFFSKIESNKANHFFVQNEKKAQKKLENIKRDHEQRLLTLRSDQEREVLKAQLLEANEELVNNIILMINHALSNQMDWTQLESSCMDAKERGDPLAHHIVQFNLQANQITVRLCDPFNDSSSFNDETTTDDYSSDFCDVVVDLGLNALSNARKYYDRKRSAVKKEEKTMVASHKAFKSAAHKAAQTRKDMKSVAQISKIRKPMWFEKFFWFISSENYLIVAGRDSQQNEVLVKRHLGPNDVYVHADLHGASSVIVKNRPLTLEESNSEPSSGQGELSSVRPPLPPPKTLNEAGVMAITLSSAWNARVITSAWWVRPEQVSKTAPTGEYLTTGAFMIRGRKNYLPPCHFVYGFGLLFKLDDDSVESHKGERRLFIQDDTTVSTNQLTDQTTSELVTLSDAEEKDEPNINSFPDAQLNLDLFKSGNNDPSAITIARSRGKQPPQVRKVTQQQPEMAGSGEKPAANQRIGLKRGQKAKLKKIKQKYAEQDETERLMRMTLLQGEKAKLSQHHKNMKNELQPEQEHEMCEIVSVEPDECDGIPTVSEHQGDNDDKQILSHDSCPASPNGIGTVLETPEGEVDDQVEIDEGDVKEERIAENDWLRLMDTLTGQPNETDVLLYALPVCAPYTALANYKFKVKLTPGTAKRGKAAKIALHTFLTDKSANAREKELVRLMKGEDVSRNFPGSVKIALPQGNQSAKRK